MKDLSGGPIAQDFEQSIILTFPGQALSHGVAGSTLSWVPQCDSNSARLSCEKCKSKPSADSRRFSLGTSVSRLILI